MDGIRFWRLFIRSLPLQAPVIGLLATLCALLLHTLAPATFAALEWAPYDTWLRHRLPIQASPSLTIIRRDPAGDDRFGAGPLDRMVLATLITAAHDAGASAIGLDHRLDYASPAQLDGATSDALLLEAMETAGPVVFVQGLDSTLSSEAAIHSQVIVATEPDHVTRHIPLLASVNARTLPAFGSVLYDLSRQKQAPRAEALATASAEPVLVNLVGNGSLDSLPTLPLSAVWNAVQQRDHEALEAWFKDKVAVILTGGAAAQDTWLLPTGQPVSGTVMHLHLLNSLLTHQQLHKPGAFAPFTITLLIASLVGWCLLRYGGSTGLLAAGATISIYLVLLIAALPLMLLVLPTALPLVACLFVVMGSTAWTHLTASQRLVLLERDMLRIRQDEAAVRESLTRHESRAEALQEDLDTARAAVARSAGEQEDLSRTTESLRADLATVQLQEQEARRQLEQLERQLHGLREAGIQAGSLGDAELDHLRSESRQFGIVTQDSALLRLFHDVKKGSKSPLTVLLLGEPGTGKELFARAVHRLSPRAGRTFIAVNMAAISPELFESELFGHTKGSFTGATADRRGYFELANHGTIFLDEIGDLRLDHQSKLLRVLQEKSFYRVGATTATTVDVRVVAATNRDLQRGVSEGWFREDLYFRLTGLIFRLPPLRERPGDIASLAEAALADIARQLGKPLPKLSNDALRALETHTWPGNVRELRHTLERAVALTDQPIVTVPDLYLESRGAALEKERISLSPDTAGDKAVLDCLRRQDFDMQATAKTLGWDRSTVTQRLKGLCFQALVEADGDRSKAASSVAGDPGQVRTVELKLTDYYQHLLSVIEPCSSPDDALIECKRRFKNLPDRHFQSVETLVRRWFAHHHRSMPHTSV
ncbi:putative transmembrane signal transduction receptor and sigma-54 dependent response regulator [Nitrospira japonica]|uniref:Putative transmembrane signal transduction receptor and sigma-54 dependent response regulator n=1 Tax=Nitrospira japonica TaxID=1325564 RepID=A0A1W1I586_9BACT|nr:sigma 54-interacting transcriptional regulator [Nitrospira japonica]SLM48145.1 putative transmembrane signal transduction receptor and sigma-54 dependent response regulator [Nitrospira japonica]